MNGQMLRKVVSDVSSQISKFEELQTIANADEVMQAECECCGLREEYTQKYINKVRDSYSGNWVCGLCSEAVRETLERAPVAMEEALSNHRNFCQEFNSTTRLNPKLALTSAMKDIAKKSNENRKKNPPRSKIARSSSCVPRITLTVNQ